MNATYILFQKFYDINIATEVEKKLKQNGIECIIEGDAKFFDPSFANSSVDPNITIKIKSSDYEKAHETLDSIYQNELDRVENDYYLLDFTDEELFEVISKADEWGRFDYLLAQKLLLDRGKEVKMDAINLLKEQRLIELSKPETMSPYIIYFGYFVALIGGIFGLFLGFYLGYFKKTLPDGQKVFVYNEKQRNHGKRILVISTISSILWIIIRWLKKNEY